MGRAIKPLIAWTTKEQAFVRAYMRHGNASRAVREARYRISNGNVARSMGHELLNKPHIRQLVSELHEEVRKRSDMRPERILDELAAVAFFNVASLIEIDGDGRAHLTLKHATSRELAAIGSARETEHGLQFTFHSKVAALELLGRFHRLFPNYVEVNASDLAERMRRARNRPLQEVEQG